MPVMILGETVEVPIDTGAFHSFISRDLVQQLDIKVNKVSDHSELADKFVKPRIGETENLDVSCGKREVSAPFEVLDQKESSPAFLKQMKQFLATIAHALKLKCGKTKNEYLSCP
ncbi:hypothetical protein EDD21DRAFT_359165 [Dissophora ornata]|nr:hypothetical protein EDD21DRAFT_359165 [Dissophora ornata]